MHNESLQPSAIYNTRWIQGTVGWAWGSYTHYIHYRSQELSNILDVYHWASGPTQRTRSKTAYSRCMLGDNCARGCTWSIGRVSTQTLCMYSQSIQGAIPSTEDHHLITIGSTANWDSWSWLRFLACAVAKQLKHSIMDQRSKVWIPPVASQVKHFLYPSSPRKTLLPWKTLLPLGDPPPLGRPAFGWKAWS